VAATVFLRRVRPGVALPGAGCGGQRSDRGLCLGDRLARWLPRRPAVAVAVAGVGGAALPGCECGSVPVARRLFGEGVAGAAALTFMLSAPAINPVVLVATAVAFPGQPAMVLARCCGLVDHRRDDGPSVAAVGRTEWVTRRLPTGHDTDESRWTVFTEAARHDFLQAASYLVLGAAAAAVLRVAVPPWVFQHLAGHLVLGVLTMALFAVVLALCSEADAFVAASLTMLPLLPRLGFSSLALPSTSNCQRCRRGCSAARRHPVRAYDVRRRHGRRDHRRSGVPWRCAVSRGTQNTLLLLVGLEHRGDGDQGHLPALREAGTAAVAESPPPSC